MWDASPIVTGSVPYPVTSKCEPTLQDVLFTPNINVGISNNFLFADPSQWRIKLNFHHKKLHIFATVLRIQIRIRNRMFLGLLDPDPDPSIIMQNSKKNLDSQFLLMCNSDFLSLKNYVNVHTFKKQVISRKTFFLNQFLVGILKANDENNRILWIPIYNYLYQNLYRVSI